MFARRSVIQSVVGDIAEESAGSSRQPRAYSSDAQPVLGKSSFADRGSAPTLKDIRHVHEWVETPKASREVNWRYVGAVSLLNTALAAAVSATVAAHGVVLGVVLPHIILTAPDWLLVHGATVIGASALLQFGWSHFLTKGMVERAGRKSENADEWDRVAESLKRLSEKRRMPIDLLISVRENDPEPASLLDRLFQRDIVALRKELVAKLTDAELDAIVAHEVCHSNRSITKIQIATGILGCFTSPAIFWGTALPVYSALSQSFGSLLAGGAAVITSGIVWIAAMTSFALAAEFISRKDELRTDLRAVKLTGELSAYLSVLTKLHTLDGCGSGRLEIPSALPTTHPSFEQRYLAVTRVFSRGSSR